MEDLNKANSTRLNLACGRMYLPEYINIDNESMYDGQMTVDKNADVLTLEWEPNSVEHILVCHFVMYIHVLDIQNQINKWYSWLKEGGVLTIETGDLKAIARTILVSNNPAIINGTNAVMQLFGWDTTTGHKWAYCYDTLAPLLAKAGFKQIGWTYGGLHQRPERDITITAVNNMIEIKNKNVAVCGGAGFLGSHLVKHLIEDRNCNVLVLDNLIAGKMDFVHPKATFEWCDITHSESELRKFFEKYEIEYVFNYAASPYIPVSFERPLHVFDINASGALKVMNAAQDAGVKGILQVSSAEIYGDAPEHKINEEYPARPHSTYGAAKLAIDILVQARWKEAKTPCIALRQFNCVGERETHEYVIPVIIEQLSKSNTVKLGNNSFRDFQYAGDAVRMAVELLEKGQFGEVYNMGSEEGIKMYDLAEMIGELMDVKATIEVDPARIRPWEIWHLQSDNTKLYNTITTRPQTSLKDALQLTIEDYKRNGWSYER